MLFKNKTHNIVLLNIWIAYNFFLVLASHFPFWENVSLFSWINSSLYFLLFLISLSIFLQDKFTKSIFINLSLTFIFYAILFFNIFIGGQYLFGDNSLAYSVMVYKKIVLHFLTALSLFFIFFKYIMRRKRGIIVYILSLFIAALVAFCCFYHFLLNTNFIFQNNTALQVLARAEFFAQTLLFIPIIGYGVMLYRHDRPNGEYINLIMVGFFFFNAAATVDAIFRIIGESDFTINQIILLVNLSMLFFVLFLKLKYTYSSFGKFYENLLFANSNFVNLKIVRRGTSKINFFKELYRYLSQRRLMYTVLGVLVLSAINISRISWFIKINIFVMFLCSLTVLLFFTSLYLRRSKSKNVLEPNK